MKKLTILAACVMFMASCALDPAVRRDKCVEITQEAFDLYWGNDWKMVIKLTTDAIGYDNEHPWPYSMRGAAYNATGRYDLALEDLNRAVQLSPDFMPAFTNRGLVYMNTKQYDKAKADFKEAIKLSANNVINLVNMAEIFSIEDDLENSCFYMKKAIAAGFDDIRLIEEKKSFENLLYSDCYNQILPLIEAQKNKRRQQ